MPTSFKLHSVCLNRLCLILQCFPSSRRDTPDNISGVIFSDLTSKLIKIRETKLTFKQNHRPFNANWIAPVIKLWIHQTSVTGYIVKEATNTALWYSALYLQITTEVSQSIYTDPLRRGSTVSTKFTSSVNTWLVLLSLWSFRGPCLSLHRDSITDMPSYPFFTPGSGQCKSFSSISTCSNST